MSCLTPGPTHTLPSVTTPDRTKPSSKTVGTHGHNSSGHHWVTFTPGRTEGILHLLKKLVLSWKDNLIVWA